MPELIDKAKVLKYLTPRIKTETPYGEGYNKALEDAAELVALMPTIEPDVRHGRWIETRYNPVGDTMYCDCNCSNCNFEIAREKGQYPKFCENCGVRMDGGTNNG